MSIKLGKAWLTTVKTMKLNVSYIRNYPRAFIKLISLITSPLPTLINTDFYNKNRKRGNNI